MPETVDQKARTSIAAHEAVCAVIREQQIEAAKLNREEHREIMKRIHDLSVLLQKYDKHAIFRWITFGGALLTIIAVATLNHLTGP